VKQSLNIFVVHPSDMLTDHLPHGAGWIVYNYLKGLTERGHTVHVAVPRVEMRGPVPPGMHLHPIPRKGGRLNYMLAVRALLTRLSASVRFDIVQQFTPVETGLSLGVLGLGIPLVLGPYSGFWPVDADGPPRRMSWVRRLKLGVRDSIAYVQQRQARALVITCPAAAERIRSRRALETRVHVIGHGIDSEGYAARERVPEEPSVLFLANLEYRKGIFTLLEAFDRMAASVPACTLQIWGTGSEAGAVDRRIEQSPFKDRIYRRGHAPRERVSEIMRSHSVYCMPSHGEPFGMTLLEAMASGVPVVTTDCGGPPHILHRDGGRIVPRRDAQGLADGLVEIVSNRELQRSMGLCNRRRVEEEFDWSRSLDRMESVYEQVLAGPPARQGAGEVSA
jgi:glycosyltransferase involved in cell wall biosynthesis